jgi:hypothetical protein
VLAGVVDDGRGVAVPLWGSKQSPNSGWQPCSGSQSEGVAPQKPAALQHSPTAQERPRPAGPQSGTTLVEGLGDGDAATEGVVVGVGVGVGVGDGDGDPDWLRPRGRIAP